MIIMNYQVQSTLRAYDQQLAEKSRLARVKAPKNPGPKDEVILSQESKKRLTAQKITQQLIRQFTDGSELADTHREVLSRLSREYGQPVSVEKKEGQGLVFIVPEGKSSEGRETVGRQSWKDGHRSIPTKVRRQFPLRTGNHVDTGPSAQGGEPYYGAGSEGECLPCFSFE